MVPVAEKSVAGALAFTEICAVGIITVTIQIFFLF